MRESRHDTGAAGLKGVVGGWAGPGQAQDPSAGRAFQDEQTRINWALTFFKTGQAASFADRILRTQSRTGNPYFANWSAFELEFKKRFTPRNRQVTAITQLEGSSWYQGSDSVDDGQVQEGSQQILADDGVDYGPAPAFNNLEAWIEAAQRVADARETSKVFEENIRAVEKLALHGPKALTTIPRTLPPAPPARTFNYQAPLPIPVANTRPEPTKVPDGPVPMDVNRTRGKASISNIKPHCRREGGALVWTHGRPRHV
ncbi:hypothetical protein M422DRAFT_245790 [Sphaerobolus stellatus SS14]|nr:hypothetical protein M422DRAFT_245790 [Sphaerobolus stellatus SS14]